MYSGDGNDTVDGGTGDDFLFADLSGRTDDIMINLATGTGTIAATSIERAQITTGSGNDTIVGSAGNDQYLWGFSGNDTVSGGNGDDVLYGGEGADVVNGDAGNDTLFDGDYGFPSGSADNDTLNG
ncbi:MAG: hypothetical protein MUF49_29700, partial [Oculatellaceae cyanobacterium Prado106]|nr:hypothetical protein [Oculatellaceae cyanobacterium Prado106]